jgi:hypothetical protein
VVQEMVAVQETEEQVRVVEMVEMEDQEVLDKLVQPEHHSRCIHETVRAKVGRVLL